MSLVSDFSAARMFLADADAFAWTVGNATKPGGTNWGGNFYETTVEYIPAGVLLNDTSDGINHPYVALPGQNAQDGRVALLTVIQTVISPEAT